LRLFAAKNSRKRRAARSPASAIIAGTTTAPCNAGASSAPRFRGPPAVRRYPRHAPRIKRPGVAARRLRRGASENAGLQTCQTVPLGRCRAFICLGARSIKTRAAQRSVAGQPHRSLPGQGTRRLARGRDDHRGPALSADLSPAFSAPNEGRQVETSASTLAGWLRQFVRTNRPAMDRARWV
jgi:hypothetical protein